MLSEVESVCDRIALIRSGRLLRVGSLVELRTVRAHRVEAVVERPGDPADLARVPGVTDAQVIGELITCTVHGPVGPLPAWLTSYAVVELDSRELSLEEVFLTEFTAPAPDPTRVLVFDSLRSRRLSTAAWTVVGGLIMFGMALAIDAEIPTAPANPSAWARNAA